jgi:rare lipoprotein A
MKTPSHRDAWGLFRMLALPRAVLISCVSFLAMAGSAEAQRAHAPIEYARQGGYASSAAPDSLAGGGARSYGYGAAARPHGGAIIDIRRPDTGGGRGRVEAVSDVVDPDEAPVEDPVDEDAAQAPAASPAAEQGATPWLERERVGPPYQANGRWYVPTPEPGYEQTGTASWYGPTFNGGRTASGETFDQTALTAAHPTLPIPSLVQVTNLENGREVIVRVNDRGPFVGNRLIDLSQGAAQVLGIENHGTARVHVRYLGPAPRHDNADGSAAAPSSSLPAAAQPSAPPEEGPQSLRPPPAPELAGGNDNDDADEAPIPRPVATPVNYSSNGAFVVQVGAFSDPANAQRVRDAVSPAGQATVDTRRAASGAELFRVRLGPFASRDEADAARSRVAALGYGEAVVAGR